MRLDILRDISLKKSIEERKKSFFVGSNSDSGFDNRSRAPSYGTVNKIIGDYDHLLKDVGQVNFNIHRFVE